ncbi:LamG-like jellyroll fold domain-containing protein [Micromonospora sp. CPCC 206061]|uniref:LamG-like jellyroll fold domain-containing protein n=1 Tax=Micromonospora sp. CPCC 206061 TaxID=3122410 RepID=UPI002FF39833
MGQIGWGRVTAVFAAVTVAVTAGAAGLGWPEPVGRDGPGQDAAGMVRVAEAPDQGSAVRAAHAQGSRVEAVDLRTETRTVYAEPDGTMTAELSARAVRARQADGTWSAVDTTLVRRPDGTVGPRAAVVDLSFSGGGAKAPMVRYGSEGRWVALAWPGRLPAPTLSGNTATYPEVLPGVDLLLTADVDGYAQHLVVKNRAAAANPAVRAVRLGLRTGGVTLEAGRDGELTARDAKGAVLYAAPVSRMWDAGTPRREATVGVAVEKGALVLRPDRALLSGASTKYPVTVDPVWHTADKHRWTSVLSGNPGTPYPNTSGAPPYAQVGQCYVPSGECNGIGLAHTYWMFDTSFLTGRLVISADLQLKTMWSPSCNSRTHQVWLADAAIHDGTSWSNKPGGIHTPVNFTAPEVYAGCEGYKDVGIGVAHLVNRGGTTTFLVQPADRNDQLAWRKYENNAKLRVNFNRVPDVPRDLRTDPPLTACHWCGGVPYVGDDNVRLMATLTDPDGDQMQSLWQVKVNGAVYSARSAFQNNGFTHSYDVSTVNRHNMAVEWAVKAEDTALHGGGWANGTTFAIDKQPPASPPSVGGTPYVADNRWHGGVGVPGKFVFGAAGVTDVDHYLWGWTQDPSNKVLANALGGSAVVTLTPPGDGPRDLFVQSVDRAGHRSAVKQYHFYVRAGSGPLAQWSLDGNAKDEAFLGWRDGVVQGSVTYTAGAVGQAARFDGSTGYVTAPSAVRTDASFSASAWVKLDSAGYARAVVSQSGTSFPGFAIWYRPENGGHWGFGMPKSTESYQGTDMALSAQPAQVGVWTHLTGVYDAATRKLTLYVNGVAAGTAQRSVADWAIDGRVQIGRTMWQGSAGVDYWTGLLDEVKIYDRAVSAAEVSAAVGADNVQVGHWKFDELSGTTGRNEVPGGEMAALHGDAAFTGDSDGDGLADGGAVGGAVTLDGVGDYAATSGPAVRTDQSFTIAGWVQLDQAPNAGNFLSALSQDGSAISGFFLGYRQRATGGGVWEFSTPGSDAAGAPAGGAGVQSAQAAQLGKPAHLAAVYDATAGKIRLYVNGSATPVQADRADGFDARGPLAIGRGLNGTPGGYWKGWIDEVRAYSRALSTAEVQAIVSRDDVALGEWRLDGNADSVDGKQNGTLAGTPTWTSGQSDAPDPTDRAVRLSGADHIGLPSEVDIRHSFAVSAWAKLDQVGGSATVVSQDGPSSSLFQLMAIPDGRWSFAMSVSGAAGATVNRVDGPEAQVGVWTHLVGIYDAGAGQLSLYVNGVQAGAAKPHQQAAFPTGGKLQIGAGQSSGNRQNRLIGAIDDVAVYGRVLFAAEIRAMAGRDLTLAHNWRLDEGSGDLAADAVGRRTATLASSGVVRVPGRLGNAVDLDGNGGHLATGGVDIRTDTDFSVSAWVRIDRTCPLTPGQWECKLVAVSLDGAAGGVSKFRLGHWRDNDQFIDGVWVFEMPEPNGAITKAAVRVLPSDIDTWTHLAGVYDKATGALVLYVNGTRKGEGRINEPWNTTGGVQIGRGRDTAGTAGQYFPGLVDDVRVYSGRLDDDRIRNLYGSYPIQCGTLDKPEPCPLPAANGGHWRFDEGAGTAVANATAPANPAAMSGGADWTGGRIGAAGRFDGASGYAQTSGPVLDATTPSYSFSAWVAAGATTPTTNQVVLALAGNASPFYLYREAGGRWSAAASVGSATAPALVSVRSTETVWPGQWTHLGLVYDADSSQLRLYVNGRLSAAQTGVSALTAGGPLSVGRGRWANTDLYFQGVVDDVRGFKKALRDGEMAKVYDDTSPTSLGSWTFDDRTVNDSSWRQNPTTASGGVSYVTGAKGTAVALADKGSATTRHPGIVPPTSFTVSSWVRLTHEPQVQAVVAQDGNRNSGFALQYRPELDTWVFGAWTQDSDGAEFRYARSRKAAVLGEWTHLTGVYDHAAGQLRIYVNGELTGAHEGVTMYPAVGGLTIGRGKFGGAPAQHLTGEIDDVRVDLGMVPDGEIARRATRA